MNKKVVQRWTQPDPLAEKFSSHTPYNYCVNNPVLMIDPDGMASTYNWETKKYEDEKGQEVSWNNVQKEYGIDQHGQDASSNVDQGVDDKKKGQPLVPTNNIAQGEDGWNGGKIMAGTLATAGVMFADDATVIGIADDPAIPFVLAGGVIAASVAYAHDAFVGTNSRGAKGTDGTHTTYQPPSTSPLNNKPRGFDPKQPPNYGGAAGWMIRAALAYKLYDTYKKQNNLVPLPTPAVDNTYVAPKLYPYVPK